MRTERYCSSPALDKPHLWRLPAFRRKRELKIKKNLHKVLRVRHKENQQSLGSVFLPSPSLSFPFIPFFRLHCQIILCIKYTHFVTNEERSKTGCIFPHLGLSNIMKQDFVFKNVRRAKPFWPGASLSISVTMLIIKHRTHFCLKQMIRSLAVRFKG